MPRLSLSSIDWRNMGRLKRFFTTEAEFGADAGRLITDPWNFQVPSIASTKVASWAQSAVSSKTSLAKVEEDGANEAYPKTHHLSEATRIAIRTKGRVIFVDPIEVVVAKAQGNYVALVHKSGCYLVRETMVTAEQKLTAFGFVRIHRSILVNAALVRDLRRDSAGTYVLRTADGNEHPVGRAYKDNLKSIAVSWLGVDPFVKAGRMTDPLQ